MADQGRTGDTHGYKTRITLFPAVGIGTAGAVGKHIEKFRMRVFVGPVILGESMSQLIGGVTAETVALQPLVLFKIETAEILSVAPPGMGTFHIAPETGLDRSFDLDTAGGNSQFLDLGNIFTDLAGPEPADPHILFKELVNSKQSPGTVIVGKIVAFSVVSGNAHLIRSDEDHTAVAAHLPGIESLLNVGTASSQEDVGFSGFHPIFRKDPRRASQRSWEMDREK